MIVIDASVALKWFFPEADSDRAIALLELPDETLVAPDLFAVEVCAAFVRAANMDKARRGDAATFLAEFGRRLSDETVQLRRVPEASIPRAADLAIGLGHPLKDCIYLALAMELACPLVTADERFAARARTAYEDVQTLA